MLLESVHSAIKLFRVKSQLKTFVRSLNFLSVFSFLNGDNNNANINVIIKGDNPWETFRTVPSTK